MSSIIKNLQKSKRRSFGSDNNILSPVERKTSSRSFGEEHSDEHEDSQHSSDGGKKKKNRRKSTEIPHLDSFKNMFALASPRSTKSHKSPRSDSSTGSKSPRSPTTILGKMKQIATYSKHHAKLQNQNLNEEVEKIENFPFELAITIIGSKKNLEKFNEVFHFLHRLDALETFEDEEDEKKKLGLLHEMKIRSKSQITKVQISNISTSEQLDILST